MIRVSGIARRYARAFFRLCKDDVAVAKKFVTSLDGIKQLFAIDMVARFLKSPVMPLETKINVLKYAMTQTKADPVTTQFILAVAEAGRVNALPEIITAFEQIIRDKEGLIAAEVISSAPLKPEEAKKIAGCIASADKVKIENLVDPKILGGFIVRVGNKVVDLSVRSQLHALATKAIS